MYHLTTICRIGTMAGSRSWIDTCDGGPLPVRPSTHAPCGSTPLRAFFTEATAMGDSGLIYMLAFTTFAL
ncbi:hypothetical protein, partial [Methylobacterium platani]|uniref:hypothetical protein n=1 Tax=Methylobacterium platani TaxID=427683 RepID=UPI001ADFAF07